MVETNFCPLIYRMATFAVCVRIILFVNQRTMDVVMTINTIDSDISEFPAFLFFMTDKTRCCQVCPFEMKIGFVMPFNRKGGCRKTFCAVAVGTILRYFLFRELSLVVIIVAIGTTTVAQVVGKLRFMTFLTIHIFVHVFQLEIGIVVVKGRHGFDNMKRLFAVALGTVLAKFIVVLIGMAACTRSKLNPRKLLKLLAI